MEFTVPMVTYVEFPTKCKNVAEIQYKISHKNQCYHLKYKIMSVMLNKRMNFPNTSEKAELFGICLLKFTL